MPNQQEHISNLWRLYVESRATSAQVRELLGYLRDPSADNFHHELFQQAVQQSATENISTNTSEAWNNILAARESLRDNWSIQQEQTSQPQSNTGKIRRIWLRTAAAAIILVIAGTVVYLSNQQQKNDKPILTEKSVLKPGTQKATLTLADGKVITLDNAGTGTLAQQGNTSIEKSGEGKITYSQNTQSSGAVMMNTMSTPRGGQYQLTLPDGSKVWLNAESSITFPAAFTERQRNVKITGEVYFEIKTDKEKPFIVNVNGQSRVEVLGTNFNVNSYGDDQTIKTTLLEGKVRMVKPGTPAVTIQPGQQAIARVGSMTENITVNKKVNIDEVMAWKNGQFVFAGGGVEAVMKELARWYDADIIYEGPKPNANFRGAISRQENIRQVLEMLELTESVHFRIEGRKIFVLAGKKSK